MSTTHSNISSRINRGNESLLTQDGSDLISPNVNYLNRSAEQTEMSEFVLIPNTIRPTSFREQHDVRRETERRRKISEGIKKSRETRRFHQIFGRAFEGID